MHKFIRLLAVTFLLLVFLASVGFAFINRTPVELSLGFWSFAPQPVAVWIISAFALGGLLGLLFAAGIRRYVRDKLEIRRLRKQLSSAEQDIARLKNLSLKDID